MPIIRFQHLRPDLEVPAESLLMKALTEAGVPVASSCGGKGVCGKCKLKILAGQHNLTPPSSLEKHLQQVHGLQAGERVSCQVHILGDITVDATYW